MIYDYESFKKDIYKLSNIDLNSYKERQMKRRIESLINKRRFSGYSDYVSALKNDKELYNEFITFITINVSEFYRNPNQWVVLEKEIIPYLTEKKKSAPLKIWSAACSTGQEPYSLAMLMTKFYPLDKINIHATDIDEQVLEKAKIGFYDEKSIKGISNNFLNKYVHKCDKGYKIDDKIKKCVTFSKHNLLKDSYPKNFDLIVCRNVLIYFTDTAKNTIYNKFNSSLNNDGILFVGSTEQIINSSKYNFKAMKTFFYQKEEDL